MPDETLTKDDLVLLMESYRNVITMHETILNQTSKAIEKLDLIATKQDYIASKQSDTCKSLEKCSGRLDDIFKAEGHVIDKIDKHHEKSIDTHSKITTKIHLGWIGMGSIIIGLIGIIVTIVMVFHHTPSP
jgi:hypothetical protein